MAKNDQSHYSAEINQYSSGHYVQVDQFTYTFNNFFHPLVGELIAKLNKTSVEGMLDPVFLQGLSQQFFTTYYKPYNTNTVQVVYFSKEIDVKPGGAYANYNWELLYHIPVMVAVHLSKNQRFAEAQKWFHYVFDPTCTDTSIPTPQRWWKFLRFRQDTDVQNVNDLLVILSTPDGDLTPAQLLIKKSVLTSYDAIKAAPFKPHVVARTRTLAYQYYVVMKYLDNLIEWGDSLFLQDTIETINEATLNYVLAANLLGPRPQKLPAREGVAQNYAQLKKAGLDAMSNAIVDLENQFPFNQSLPSQGGDPSDPSGPLFGIGRSLYFCIPQNKKLLAYWDTVADRLFKIRHCMNIEGVVRPLALFDPPIDPGMLVKAAAAGLDLGSVISGLNRPVGPMRSLPLIQKALEIANEVRSMGNSLLAALEKSDAEKLSVLRQGHEIALQKLTQDVRFLQWKQAQEATQSLLRTRAASLERYQYYLRLLGLKPDSNAPDTLPLDRRELNEANFDDAYAALVSAYDKPVALQAYSKLKLAGNSPSSASGASGTGSLFLNTNEDADLNIHGPKARDDRDAAATSDKVSSVLALIPDMGIDLHFWGLGGHAVVVGGSLFAGAGRFYSSIKNTNAANEDSKAMVASKTASYQRRADDWMFQANLAACELMQIGRQIISSLIAEQVAHHEYTNVQAQVKNAQEVSDFLDSKFTNADLYAWMQGELSRLYYQYYRFAFDTARKAEKTMKTELMRPELDSTDFIQFNYWDAGRKGLLSGDALCFDLKRMEMAYHDYNQREYEITRHISLRQLDPLALLNLKISGTCKIAIPEWIFDRDCPGHYMRRIKTVSLSIPSVVGPYTGVNCTLTLQRSTVRVSPLLASNTYARDTSGEDDRFIDYFGSVQSIVTSSGTNDSGMFETSLKDERFLPFEGAGVDSTWSLTLPASFRSFDYATISDVILHMKYTAREGGTALGTKVTSELGPLLDAVNQNGLALLFSLRYDFPTEWSAFVNGSSNFQMKLRRDYFPYLTQGLALNIDSLTLYAKTGGKLVQKTIAVPANLAGDLNGALASSDLSFPTDASVLQRNQQHEAFLIVRYHV